MEGQTSAEAPMGRQITGQFTVSMNVTDRRSVVIVGSVYVDDTKRELNARVDLAQDVIDRQFIRGDVLNKRAQITAMQQGLETLKLTQAGIVDQQMKGDKKLTSVQKQKLGEHEAQLIQMQTRIAALMADIADGEKKLIDLAG